MEERKPENIVKEVLQVDYELRDNISDLIEGSADESLQLILADLHPADIAEIINHLSVNDALYIFKLLDSETAGEVLTETDENLREKILAKVEPEIITEIVDELDTDDATDIVSELPYSVAEHVLKNIDKEDSQDVRKLLKYPEDSAGGIMNSDFVFVYDTATIKDAIKVVRLNADDFEQIYHVYVLKTSGELLGIVELKSLLITPLKQNITSIMKEDLIYVSPEVDQEEVASLMEKYDLVALPVVDPDKAMLGRITIDDIVDVIHEEASEDMQKIAGLSEEEETGDSVFRISRIRLPWLVVALIMELVAAVLLSSYEEYIKEVVIATFFIPVVMAMGGSSGTQAAIVMVRAIGTGDLWLRDSFRKLGKEFFVGLINGIVCSIILMGSVKIFFTHEGVTFYFAFILSLSLLTIILFATLVGATIPVFMRKLGADPAIATGPFVTTANDILGLLIYLTFITMFFIT